MSTWQVQSAKQRLSEVLRAAEAGEPQFITRHGETVAVIIDYADFRATHEAPPAKPSLLDFLLEGPRFDDIDEVLPPRTPEGDRPLNLDLDDRSDE